jgi:hypothetical protein
MGVPVAPVTSYDVLAEGIGLGPAARPVTPGYPGIRELAERLQIR